MSTSPQHIVPNVIQQHVEESAILRGVRSALVRGPHVKLHHLRRLDERLAAHLDGISIAGDFGRNACTATLENPQKGQVFTAAARAIEDGAVVELNRLLALAEAMPEIQPGLLSAAGWVSARFLQGTVRELLQSTSAFRRQVGISACAMHQVDPGDALQKSLGDPDSRLRARALRCIGESGRRDLLASCLQAIEHEDLACRLWAARSAALLGERERAAAFLTELAVNDAKVRRYVLPMLLKLVDAAQANTILKQLAKESLELRLLISASGTTGDVSYIPWLIKQMDDPKSTRLAGEAFSMITGLDLSLLDLDRKPPKDFEPDDELGIDDDDSLPWPDPQKLQAWWQENLNRFKPGERYFMGEPPTVSHCMNVLRDGYQRQRIAAAEHLCLLQPGSQLFPASAPAWRQERWLKKMN
ncbi:TIGR02270 family protein [Pseudoduganella violaceinigra]|uniref:TIGR02270 family protein n=1 Tax=Pseudoduganella violaceinigra TaxID=246602 RepID=UPI0003F73DAD|nr:TIGR02270 family protein [Pseudoduganella violaceinigra]